MVIVKLADYSEQGWMLRLHMASTIFVMKSRILRKDQLQIRCQTANKNLQFCNA